MVTSTSATTGSDMSGIAAYQESLNASTAEATKQQLAEAAANGIAAGQLANDITELNAMLTNMKGIRY